MEYSDKPLWYVLHTYTGYEDIVLDSLNKLIEAQNLEERILRIELPKVEEVTEKSGKKKTVLRKKYPTYIFIKVILDSSLWYSITSIHGITGFCGPCGRAQPLPEEEVKKLGFELIGESELDMQVGDTVKIISGPFESYIAQVTELNFEKQKAKISVELFGQKTTMDLEFKDIEKMA